MVQYRLYLRLPDGNHVSYATDDIAFLRESAINAILYGFIVLGWIESRSDAEFDGTSGLNDAVASNYLF